MADYDTPRQLIRSVARAFYDTRQILVVDALMVHSTLYIEDLAYVLGMNVKDLRKLCTPLRDDKMIFVHSRQEMRAGQQRPTNKDYYYVNYHMAIDAIKLRIVKLQQKVQDLYKPTQERKEFYCDRCKSEWTQMEILASVDPYSGEFVCPNCQFVLERHEISAEDAAGSARTSKLNEQIKKLVQLLQRVDSNKIPANDFEDAHSRHKAIERSALNPAVQWEAVKKDSGGNIVRGTAITAPQVTVELTTDENKRKQEEERRRIRADQQANNALPEWYTNSTVTGEKTHLGAKEEARIKEIRDGVKAGGSAAAGDEDKKPSEEDAASQAIIQDYFNSLQQAKLAEEGQNGSVASGSDDEDEDEFEDVPAANGTPASTASAGTKRKAEDSGADSGANTGVSTPAGFDESPMKKVKLEPGTAAGGDDDDDDDDDDDEGDFEDAL